MIRAIALLSMLAAAPATAQPFIAPSGSTVPENLLRIVVTLDAPVAVADPLEHLQLIDAAGVAIGHAFLPQVLVSADGRALTLTLHPGRVKADVAPNRAIGRVLRRGDVVSLRLDRALGGPKHVTWRVGAADTQGPSPSAWRIIAPAAGTRSPLRLLLDGPVDRLSGVDLIAVRGTDGERIYGKPALEPGEAVWTFTPAKVWAVGQYHVVAHPAIEDTAGNTPCAAFETVSPVSCSPAATVFSVEHSLDPVVDAVAKQVEPAGAKVSR